MKITLAAVLATGLFLPGLAGDAHAVQLKTTVTAKIVSIRGDSPLAVGEQVSFIWTYDLSSTQMHRFCDDGAADCVYDESNFTGFDFMSDAKLSLSDNLQGILPVAANPVRHLSSHETVVYGGEIAGESVFRFENRCESFYLSLFYGVASTSYMVAFKKDEKGVYGIGYEFEDLRFSTTLATADPDPEMAAILLSRSRTLRFAGSQNKGEVEKE
ncbi:MAG: hypothetical protein HY885_12660 [Deltaproteobacteria bacterium]|nr:hypothetical protein [Deltaproteobacteria bacterium]